MSAKHEHMVREMQAFLLKRISEDAETISAQEAATLADKRMPLIALMDLCAAYSIDLDITVGGEVVSFEETQP